MEEPDVLYCRRIQRARDDCSADSTLEGQLRAGARFWRESLLPRRELRTPIGEPEVRYCRRIQRVRHDCSADSLLGLDGQL